MFQSLVKPLVPSVLTAALALLAAGCATTPPDDLYPAARDGAGLALNDLVLVDCRLPGQIRQLGTRMTYLAPRRAVKTTQSDCAIRGGEFVLFDRANYATALATLLPKAEAGDPVAQMYVGEIYERGLGLPAPDPGRAAYWYRKAAESGHRPAQIRLGTLYERGLGVSKDTSVALDWYRRGVGLDQDRLVFESSLEAERKAFQQEIALRNRVAASLKQQLRQATISRPALAPATPTPSTGAKTADAVKELSQLAESQRRDAESQAAQLQQELHAIEQLKATETGAEKTEAAPESQTPPRVAQLRKLQLTRNEQYNAMLDTSRRLAQQQQ